MNLKIISAGAGSGKTYRLTEEMVGLIRQGVRPSGIIATTFTNKAAAELEERVRVKLLQKGLREEADQLSNALIGTVHALGVKLLQRFAYEAGVSPSVSIIADEDRQAFFNQSLANVLSFEMAESLDLLCDKLGLTKKNQDYDWRREVYQLSDVARSNGFSEADLQISRERSIQSLLALFPAPFADPAAWESRVVREIEETIEALEAGSDETKKTKDFLALLREAVRELSVKGYLPWHQWVKIAKGDVSVKSRDQVEPLRETIWQHQAHPRFQQEIAGYLTQVFNLAQAALHEYAIYKKRRGLIDYTDMEVLVDKLLVHPGVQAILRQEVDLLLVDEFQDTSPIQLSIFLKLSRFAKQAIWVGDPKQSIYGFRGAEPRLMAAVIQHTGGIKPENILTHSWRSREDVVLACNAIFVKAFPDLPPDQVALQPVRTRDKEPDNHPTALWNWHFEYEGEKRGSNRTWVLNALAQAVRQLLDNPPPVLVKGAGTYRPAQPTDIAILSRRNADCQELAEALHRAGLRAALARGGLLETAEAKLILACLKYLLNPEDSLSVAEILLLGAGFPIENIVESRQEYLETTDSDHPDNLWASNQDLIGALNTIRNQALELTSAEILSLVLEELDIRRIAAGWGNSAQRLSNVDRFAGLATQYEEACNRLHSAASLGGFLLWLNNLARLGLDQQSAGDDPGAIQLLTYHRSKGLEYPIVICDSLENNLQGDAWGIHLESGQAEIDLDYILANRWIRFWVNPYSDQIRRTPLEERLLQTDEHRRALQDALQEETRLLYVGLTRARDYLVFPTTAKPTRWLNRTWHNGEEDIPTLDHSQPETPWEWNGRYLEILNRTFSFQDDFDEMDPGPETVELLQPRAGRKAWNALHIDLRRETLSNLPPAFPGTVLVSPQMLTLPEEVDAYMAAKAYKALLAAADPGQSQAHRRKMAAGLLMRYGLDEYLQPDDLLLPAEAFFQTLQQTFGDGFEPLRKFPIQLEWEGRTFETIADLIWIQGATTVLVQHSGYSGPAEGISAKMEELHPWLFLTSQGIRRHFPKARQVRAFVHFVALGEVREAIFP